ncbi:glycosyltransferase family 4 protein [Candidatus Parcubacteria bacterium]|nr:glycosyltransferase family 4 protein [Patescibacteria group bacterium]MCG2689493.1 glycosyltransferase family 4 protein [Candidatus Parcubacteria bacterium]
MTFCVFIRSTTYHNKSGGLETQNKVLCEGLVKAGHKVFVVTTSLNRDYPKFGIIPNHVPNYVFTNSQPGKYSLQWFKESVKAYKDLSSKEKIDVLISQSSAGLAVFKNARNVNVKKIAINHGTSFGEFQTRLKQVHSLRNLIRLIIKDLPMLVGGYLEDYRLFKLGDKIVCVSGVVKGRVEKEFPKFQDKLVVIDNGVDIEKFKCRMTNVKLRSNDKKEMRLLTVGRVVKEKGLEVLFESLESLKELGSLRLTIVGGGSDLEYFKSLAKTLALPVDFVGEVTNEETVKYYQQADVFVLPTLRQEGFPMVLAEAMASGLPIIASRVGGIPSAIVSGENGILVTPASQEGLSNAIRQLAENPKLQETLSENALIASKEKYSQQTMVKKYLTLVVK